MSLMVVLSLCFSLIFMMPSMLQPLSLGLCVMSLSIGLCVLLGLVGSSWYGYVLFLVYVGGLLVMFAYVSALAPNNFFSSIKSVFGFVLMFVIGCVMVSTLYFVDSGFISGLVSFTENKNVVSSGMMIIGASSMCLVIVLGSVLLLNLLAVVKVCYYQQGPLRFHSDLK
uniref:NADH-ubiquinone oxidoreductase chain 6 n=1 Tax=Steromphala umbilicaris TaxID=2072697 RepID=A0A240F5K7_9VEST|nr:NADH dehydrogenase subunit 6 [Steromphala umbilicaris]AQD17685.1 NADH dehydrogenase subunit 6 [Steromphala umbilicaris]AQD17698.1 NADH dehydrogenase subunit 6 [Steromphala umbilicaris]